MKYFEFIPEGVEECSVTAWLQTGMAREGNCNKTYPAVLICPGGAYQMVSEREAEPVGKLFYAAGYHVFILWYCVGEKARGFRPLKQLAAAMAEIRSHGDEWKLEKNHIAVCGFSAGGHLACSLGTLYHDPTFLNHWKREENIRPDAMILGYPVITADEFAEPTSIGNVSGAKAGTQEYAYFGLDKHVDKDTPPTFLWHTSQDTCVPVENSLRFATALSTAKVPFELHVLPEGDHGMSVCTDEVMSKQDCYNGRWVEWCIQWLDKLFSYKR